jgi:hypothetical protein
MLTVRIGHNITLFEVMSHVWPIIGGPESVLFTPPPIPTGLPDSSRSPTGVLLDFNHFSGNNLIATELQYKTLIVN